MEAYTQGKVSAAARRAWLEMRDPNPSVFRPCRGGYYMIGWESSIAMARAFGRGDAHGRNVSPHRFDLKGVQS